MQSAEAAVVVVTFLGPGAILGRPSAPPCRSSSGTRSRPASSPLHSGHGGQGHCDQGQPTCRADELYRQTPTAPRGKAGVIRRPPTVGGFGSGPQKQFRGNGAACSAAQLLYWSTPAGLARRAAMRGGKLQSTRSANARAGIQAYWDSPAGMLRRAKSKAAQPKAVKPAAEPDGPKPYRGPGRWARMTPAVYVPRTEEAIAADRIAMAKYSAYPVVPGGRRRQRSHRRE